MNLRGSVDSVAFLYDPADTVSFYLRIRDKSAPFGTSATDTSLGVALGPVLDAHVQGPWAVEAALSYLASRDFGNEDGAVIESPFQGLRSQTIMAGIRFGLP